MGCFQSSESIDFETIQPAVLRSRGGLATYSGTTERGRCQVRLILFDLTIILF
jgi:hypothetical protein